MSDKNTHKFSAIKRVSNALLAFLVLIIAVNLWLINTKNSQQWYSYESEYFGRSLATQAARMIALPLANDDQAMLSNYVDNIESDSFIIGTSLYDEQGRTIKTYDETFSVVEQFRSGSNKPLIFVQDIIHEDNIIGYLKLVVDRNEITKHHQAYNQQQFLQILLLMLLTAIVGMMFTRLFYKIRNRYRFDDKANSL